MIWKKLVPTLVAASITTAFVLGVVLERMITGTGSPVQPTWQQSSHLGSQSEQVLKELLYDYGQFLNGLVDEGRTLTVEETLVWVDRFEEPTLTCDNLALRQSGYLALISLSNGIEDWFSAEQFCLAAIADAPDAYVEFQRLGDLYAIQAAASNSGVERAWNVPGPDKTFHQIHTTARRFARLGEMNRVGGTAIGLARWAYEHEIRKAKSQTLGDAVVAVRTTNLVRFIHSYAQTHPSQVDESLLRQHRAQIAAAYVNIGEIELALAATEEFPEFPASAHEYALAYYYMDDAGTSSFVDRAAYVQSLDLPKSNDPLALTVSNKLARDALEARTKFIGTTITETTKQPDESMSQRIRDAIEYTFIDHERIVSNALIADQGRSKIATTKEGVEQRQRLRYGLRRLTSYLRLTGQHDAADEYAMMLSRDFGDDSYFRD